MNRFNWNIELIEHLGIILNLKIDLGGTKKYKFVSLIVIVNQKNKTNEQHNMIFLFKVWHVGGY